MTSALCSCKISFYPSAFDLHAGVHALCVCVHARARAYVCKDWKICLLNLSPNLNPTIARIVKGRLGECMQAIS